MIPYSAKKSELYKELNDDRNKKFFDFRQKKFLHNIDSLYYVIKVKNDWNHDEGCLYFKSVLEIGRKKAMKSFEPYLLFQGPAFDGERSLGTEFIMNGIGSKPYLYDISKVDKYTAFIIGHQLNEKTPEIWVQIRAENLWLNGEYESVRESLEDFEKILSKFDIEIEEVKENRIDYAYHTNYVQDPTNYFSSENINRMQVSRFERWRLEGTFRGQFETETDYFTLGRKKSNNLFFRIYDKTKEVVEKGYKQFFIKLWYLNGMISYFDYCCLEDAFMQPSRTNYKYLDIARLKFYLEHGSNMKYKEEINGILNKDVLDYELIVKYADYLTPKLTKILNVEIETKRKFYYTLDASVEQMLELKSGNVPDYAKKLFVMIDNKQVFHDFLTCNNSKQSGIIRFIDYNAVNRFGRPWTQKQKFPTSDFWTRLQKTKLNTKFDVDKIRLIRDYQQKLSAQKLKKRITNSISTYSLYHHGDLTDGDTYQDILDYMSTLNENDVEDAIKYKHKKITLIQNRLDEVEDNSDRERILSVVDNETGEIYKPFGV